MNIGKVVIALATRGRPDVLRQTLEATLPNISRDDTELVVCADADDTPTITAANMVALSNPNVFVDIRAREDSLGGKYNRVIGRGDVYMVMVDYAPQLTKGFDNLIAKAASMYEDGIGFVYGPLANLSFPCMQAVTHRTAEIMGHIYPEDYAFWFVDHHMHEVAWMTGRVAMVPIQVDYVTKRQGYTTECRDVHFWTVFFDAMAEERQDIAGRLIDAMWIPEWLKRAQRLKFPWINQYSTMLHNNARNAIHSIQMDRGDPRPADERYNRIKSAAYAKYESIVRKRAA